MLGTYEQMRMAGLFAVSSVKFANNEKYLLACCSMDGNLSLCRLDPPCVLFLLKGHRGGVTGRCILLPFALSPSLIFLLAQYGLAP